MPKFVFNRLFELSPELNPVRAVILFLVFFLNIGGVFAQQDFQERTKLALKEGDSQKLSRFCSEIIEFGNDGDSRSLNAKSTSEQLARFFKANPPEDAEIQFQGKGKDGRKYMICRYRSRNGSGFRFSFYWKERASPAFESIDISRD